MEWRIVNPITKRLTECTVVAADVRLVLDALKEAESTVEAQRKEIEELRAIIGENASAAADRVRAALRGQAERDALKEQLDRLAKDLYAENVAASELRVERDALKAEVEQWHDEVRRFNAGHARHAEPYSNLEDEFEQMGWAWANVTEIAALKAEVERLNAGWQSCLEALEIAKNAMLRSGDARDSYFAEAATLRSKLSASEREVERLRAAASAAFDWSPDRHGSPDIVAALQRYRAALRGEEVQ